jgi:hypothetical protein
MRPTSSTILPTFIANEEKLVALMTGYWLIYPTGVEAVGVLRVADAGGRTSLGMFLPSMKSSSNGILW